MRTIAYLGAGLVVCTLLTLASLSLRIEPLNQAPPRNRQPENRQPESRQPELRPPVKEPAALPLQSNEHLLASLRGQDYHAPASTAATAATTTKATAATTARKSAVQDAGRNASCGAGVVALTYASHHGRDDRFCRSLESAIRNGLELNVLGWGVKWEGLSQKLGAALKAVEELPPDCVVMFTDAYDVLYTEGADEMRKKFEKLNKPLVFSGECGCWPQVTYDKGVTCRDKYPPSPTPYRFLNSGSWMGRAGVAARFLRTIVEEAGAAKTGAQFHKLNDQELASELYFKGTFGGDLGLDHYAALFQAMHAVRDASAVPNCDPWPDLRETDGVFANTRTKTRPSVFHFNGGGKQHHLEMEAKMWWKQCAEANDVESWEKLRRTKLPFNGKALSFEEVCPGHLESTRRKSGERSCSQMERFSTNPP